MKNGKYALAAILLLLLAVSAATGQNGVAFMKHENQSALIFSTANGVYATWDNYSTEIAQGPVSAIAAGSLIDQSMPYVIIANATGISLIETYRIAYNNVTGNWLWGFKKPLLVVKFSNITDMAIGRPLDHNSRADALYFATGTSVYRVDPKWCPCGTISWGKPALVYQT